MKKLISTKLFIGAVAFTLGLAACDGGQQGGGGGGNVPTYNEPSVQFHYQRTDGNYADWDMWIWEKDQAGGAFAFNGKDDFGAVASYPLSTWTDPVKNSLGFIVRKGGDSWAEKDLGGGDLYVDFSLYQKDAKDVYHFYLKTGDSNIYTDAEGHMKGAITLSTFANTKNIAVNANMKIESYKIFEGEQQILTADKVSSDMVRVSLPDSKSVDFEKDYRVTLVLVNGDEVSAEISKNGLFGTEEFGELYNYLGDDLGANYTKESTTIKVWAPFSKIKLNIYNTGTPKGLGGSDEHTSYDMVKGEKGVHSYTLPGDMEGKYYTFEVTNATYKAKEVVDPYAKSAGVNGVRGMIVDFAKTNPTGWDEVSPLQIDKRALTVYETHVADVTSSETWTGTEANRKLFKGMYESGTTYTANNKTVTTGFDHIKELGVNAVQIIPLFDQANNETKMEFNWGYNPLNYNVVEGGYSSNPHDGYVRIKEFKELVQAYNEAGINIIMDVVYNHHNGALGSNFDVLFPGYYYRYNTNGDLSNGSGCGNETASDHYMFRKFMVDSTKFWAEEYKLGGFRFDLMGLHDLETMEELTAELKEINPTIAVYGEPWTGGTSPLDSSKAATQANGNKYVGYGAFNDKIRDALIKGGLSGKTELGWITNTKSKVSGGDMNAIISGVKGITEAARSIADPDKSVSYVTCHDNYTLYDRIIASGAKTAADDADIAKMNVLANSVVFTSQGTTFMLAGEEFLRTKGGNSNSYNASYKVNELDYSLKIKHEDMFHNYQKLIALKQNLDGLHLDKDHINTVSPSFNSTGSTLSYTLNDAENDVTYKVIHVNGLGDTATFDLSGYTLYLATVQGEDLVLSSETLLKPYETVIAYKAN